METRMPRRMEGFHIRKNKKSRMSDHSRRHIKPTSEEVYQDAKKILEEYLKRKLNEPERTEDNNNKRYARSESYKAASKDNLINDGARSGKKSGENYGVERSKTMPSTFRIEKDVKIKENKRVKRISRDYEYSSPDTDMDFSDDEENGGRKRKKKGFFKRAKERFLHALHRDNRSGNEGDLNVESNDEKIRKKKKSKPERHVTETHAHVEQRISVGEDGNTGSNFLGPGENSSTLSHSSSSRRNSAGKRFFDTIRKSFRKSKNREISISKSAEPVSQEDGERSYSRSISTPDRSLTPADRDSTNNIPSQNGSDAKDSKIRTHSDRSRKSSRSHADVEVSQCRDDSAPRTIRARGVHYMEGMGQAMSAAPPHIPPGFRGTIQSSVDIDRRDMTLADDGLWERSATTHVHEDTRYHGGGSLEIDGHSDDIAYVDEIDSPDDPKDEAIDKIVKKLIEIGDNLSLEGEARLSHDTPGAVGGADDTAAGGDALSQLEQELIACLRSSGDTASETIDGPTNNFINGQVRQTVYDRFSTTLRQSVGDEVNWNQMALVFHTTKSALKVAGAGTKMANDIKNITLTYLTEKCASWIYDQGGWESIVSDTDSELD